MSDTNDLAKFNARLNILNVLGTRQLQEDNVPTPTSPSGGSSSSASPLDNSPPTNDSPSIPPPTNDSPSIPPPTNDSPSIPPPTNDSPSIPPPIRQTGQEITAEHLEQEKLQRVKSVVKALQVETRGPPPVPPPKSPTTRRPLPRARSPYSSPSRQRTIADPTTRTARRSNTPPRPPPPKFGSMKRKVANLEINLTPQQSQPSVTPPASPMRRRSDGMVKEKIQRPKPTVRRRNKFQSPGEEAKRVSAIEEHDGEGVTEGSKKLEVESHDQQRLQEEEVNEDAPAQQGSSDDTRELEKSGDGEDNPTNQDEESKFGDGSGEGWEMINEVPNISVSANEQQSDAQDQRCTLKKQKSEEITPTHGANLAVSSDPVPPLSPDLTKSNKTTKRKRPPPFRPPPYTPKTPPIPQKLRKSMSSKLAEEAKRVVRPVEVRSPESTPEPEEHRQALQPLEEATNDHVYEFVDAPTQLFPVENGHVPGRIKYLGSSSSDTSISPSHTLSRSTSVGNTNGILTGDAGNKHSGSVSLSTLRNTFHQGDGGKKMRPRSEASSATSLTSIRDFETSFELIPETGSRLEDVMSTFREADPKYQDSNIYELVQACSRAMPHIASTSELPPRIPDFPTDGRSLVIHELYTTEYTYVKGLEVLDEVFKVELAPVLLDETSRVFANIYDILAFNKGFLALLHTRLSDWGPEVKIGDIFIGMFTQSHKSMYAIYCSNYDSAEMMVVTRLKRRKEFELALQGCLSNTRVMPGLTLPAYLITPVQRIPRYILLLKDIIKRTQETHPDYKNLVHAEEIMGELADYINAQVSESQTKKTLDTLKNKVQGLADLDSPDRNLVKEGQVYLKNVKKLYQCILFNDLLVFAHGDSRQSIVELSLSLEAVWVEDLEDLDPQTSNEDAIEVYTPERPYTIYTQTKAEKRLWLNKLRETIYQHLRDQNKCDPNKECETKSRKAKFVYADQRIYDGKYVDAKRNGKGKMSWPNKSLYVGDWIDDERCGKGEFAYNTGDVYNGSWNEDKQNGFGELQYASDDIYRGYWKDGVRHGKGKIVYANGDQFEGLFQNGQIEGEGNLNCVNGVEYKGEWKHSQRHGKGILRFVCGNVYKGEFQYNQIHGQGQMTYKNGDCYDGRWKNGMRNGQGRLKSKQEGEYDGCWEDDLRHGFGKLKYPNRDYYEGGWELNRRHGRGKIVYSTGQEFNGEFMNDIINGEGDMRYSEVSKYHGGWLNGLRHGYGAMVYEDKSSYNGDWQNGLRHGHGEFVSADGAVYRGMWLNDKAHGKGTLSIKGPQLSLNYAYSGDWVCGKREGRGEEQSQYGQYKGGWKADMKNGVGEERTLVGTIFEGSWDKGRKHGRGVRKMIFGTVEEQSWKSGQLTTDPLRMTAVELPYISRNDL